MAAILFGVAAFSFASCETRADSRRAEMAIEAQTPNLKTLVADKDLKWGAPIFLRIVKTDPAGSGKGYLKAFMQNDTGNFIALKRWEICTWSGSLGPKLKEGDGQSPEGFYFVKPSAMNPNSSYHLSFNLGFPNAYDRAHGRTGSFLMVHGDCVSIGCYAMTNKGIEEIYTLMSAAFASGQPFVRVHIFPFEMNDIALKNYTGNPNYAFWQNLKQGWDWFEKNKRPPNVTVIDKSYQFNTDG